VLRIAVLNNEWVELRLQWYGYLDKYFNSNWKPKEILVSYKDGKIRIYITFEKDVILRKPGHIMGIDINFNNVTYTIVNMSEELVSMGVILFNGLNRALARRVIAEKIERRYSRKWRFVKGIREAIKRLGRRARNILTDSCHYISKRIVEIAKEYKALIVLENLNKLKVGANGSRGFNKKLSLWTYRRIQSYIHYKALIEGLSVTYVNPRNTSKTSPIEGKLEFINYRRVKLPNRYIITRDIIASWNIALKGLKLYTRDVGSRGSVETPKALEEDVAPNPMKGKPVRVPLVSKIT